MRRRFTLAALPLALAQVPAPTFAPPGPPPVTVAPVAPRLSPTPDPTLPSVTLPPELDRVLRDYERAWTARNSEGLARLFTEDGFAMSNGAPAMRGRAAIRRSYGRNGGPLSLRALAFHTEGAAGWIVGGYSRSKGEPDVGKFVLLLRRGSDGRWMIAADIDNSNSRPSSSGPRTPTPTPYVPVVPRS